LLYGKENCHIDRRTKSEIRPLEKKTLCGPYNIVKSLNLLWNWENIDHVNGKFNAESCS